MIPISTNSSTQMTGGASDALVGGFSGPMFDVDKAYINIKSPIQLLLFGLAILLAFFLWLKLTVKK